MPKVTYSDVPTAKTSWLDQLVDPIPAGQRMAQQAADEANSYDKPSLNRTPENAWWDGLKAGAHEAAGKVAAGFTSPAGLASLLGGVGSEGAVGAGLNTVGKGLKAAEIAGSGAFGLHGAGKALSDVVDPKKSWGDVGGDVAETAQGALGTLFGLKGYHDIPAAAPSSAPSFEVQPTAVAGGRVMDGKGGLSPVRNKTINGTGETWKTPAQPVESPSADEQGVPYSPAEPAPYRSAAKSAQRVEDKASTDSFNGQIKAQALTDKEAAAAADQKAAQQRIQDAKDAGLKPQDPTVSESVSAKIPGGRERLNQRYAPPEPEADPDTEYEAAFGGDEPYSQGKGAGFTLPEPEMESGSDFTDASAQPAESPESPLGKILTPGQKARQDSYSALLAKLKGEAPPSTVEGPTAPPVTPQGPSEPRAVSGGAAISPDLIKQAENYKASANPFANPDPSLNRSGDHLEQLMDDIHGPDTRLPGNGEAPMSPDEIAAHDAEMRTIAQTPSDLGPPPESSRNRIMAAAGIEQPNEGPTSQLAKFFKSRVDAAGQGYRDIKAAKASGENVPQEGYHIAGQNLRREGQAVGLPATGPSAPRAAKAPVAASEPIPAVQREPDSTTPLTGQALADFFMGKGRFDLASQQAPDVMGTPGAGGEAQTAAARNAALAKRKANPSESGSVDPAFLAVLARMAAGGLAGGVAGGHVGHPILGAIGGGIVGAGLGEGIPPETLQAMKDPLNKGLEVANKFHNAALLSPTSVGKKALGDVGGLASAVIENPSRTGALLKALTSGMPEAVEAFKSGYHTPYNEQEPLNGAESLVQNGPLSWAGKTMAGLTAGTKNVMDQGGFSPEEQKYYTLTAEPKYGPTSGLLRAQRSSKAIQHFSPFARITTNRLERGWERSVLGIPSAVFSKDPDISSKALKLAGMGTAVSGLAASLTPKDFVKNHPVATGLIAATGGPYGIPIAAGMASQSMSNQTLPQMAQIMTQDIPGLRTIEDINRSPVRSLENYLSGYTNATAPIAQAIDPRDVDTTQSGANHLLDKAESNVPFLRGELPSKALPQRPGRIRYSDIP